MISLINWREITNNSVSLIKMADQDPQHISFDAKTVNMQIDTWTSINPLGEASFIFLVKYIRYLILDI